MVHSLHDCIAVKQEWWAHRRELINRITGAERHGATMTLKRQSHQAALEGALRTATNTISSSVGGGPRSVH